MTKGCSFRYSAALAGLVAIYAPTARAFDFNDVDAMAKMEQGELLQKAEQAARAEDFTSARRLIDQARNKAYAPKALAAAEAVYQKQHTAYEDRKRREEEARRQAELARREAEQRAAQQSVSSSSSFVMVEAEGVCMAGCAAKNLHITGAGQFSPSYNGARSGAIHKGYQNTLAGTYRYSVQIGSNICSGTFSISGGRGFMIRLYSGCNDAGSRGY